MNDSSELKECEGDDGDDVKRKDKQKCDGAHRRCQRKVKTSRHELSTASVQLAACQAHLCKIESLSYCGATPPATGKETLNTEQRCMGIGCMAYGFNPGRQCFFLLLQNTGKINLQRLETFFKYTGKTNCHLAAERFLV